MNESVPAILSLYFPLWGARFDSEGGGAIGPEVIACVPYAKDWMVIQKTDVWIAQWRNAGGGLEGPEPPCCLVVLEPLAGAESLHDAVSARGNLLLSKARDAVTVLRLHRPGWFLQPEQAMYVFHAPSLMDHVLRFPGPYRQVFVSGMPDPDFEPFRLDPEDLWQGLESPGTIRLTWDLLQTYRRAGGDASAEIALESFNRSYGYQLRPQSRAGNLFTALDAMLGGMGAWKVGPVPVKPRGYGKRVEAALRAAQPGEFSHDPGESAQWLHAESGGRGLRNAIAHGAGSAFEAEASASYEKLQAMVRCLLKQYLRFAIRWSHRKQDIAARLDITAEMPLASAYVSLLSAEARKPGTFVDLLRG